MSKDHSLFSSIGAVLFKSRKQGGSVQDRRTSIESTGFQVKHRSKSLENIVDMANSPTIPELNLGEVWNEIELLKSLGPHIVCILPSLAHDFVASAMYAIGANPLIPEGIIFNACIILIILVLMNKIVLTHAVIKEYCSLCMFSFSDPEDVEKLLSDCKGVLVDVSARVAMIEAFMEYHVPDLVPFVLVVTRSGTDDKRKAMARKIMEKCEPTLVSGRLGDIHALGQDIIERGKVKPNRALFKNHFESHK